MNGTDGMNSDPQESFPLHSEGPAEANGNAPVESQAEPRREAPPAPPAASPPPPPPEARPSVVWSSSASGTGSFSSRSDRDE